MGGASSLSHQKPSTQNYVEEDRSDAESEKPHSKINLEGDEKIACVGMREENDMDPAEDRKMEAEKVETKSAARRNNFARNSTMIRSRNSPIFQQLAAGSNISGPKVDKPNHSPARRNTEVHRPAAKEPLTLKKSKTNPLHPNDEC